MNIPLRKWFTCACLLASSLIVFLSLVSFRKEDFFLFTATPSLPPRNLIGIAGVYLAGGLFFTFGAAAYTIVAGLLFAALKRLNMPFKSVAQTIWTKTLSFIIIIVFTAAFLALFGGQSERFEHGGLTGFLISDLLLNYLGTAGSLIICLLLVALGVLLLWTELIVQMTRAFAAFLTGRKERLQAWLHEYALRRKESQANNKPIVPRRSVTKDTTTSLSPRIVKPVSGDDNNEKKKPAQVPQPPVKAPLNIIARRDQSARDQKQKEFKAKTVKLHDMSYMIPTPSILSPLPEFDKSSVKNDIEENSRMLENTLEIFGIEARVVNADRGPTITRFELEPGPGVKINRISNLADDIALSMKAAQVRIVAPIPGKGTVGIEVPNAHKKIVTLRDVIEDKKFSDHPSRLTLAIGQDVAGAPLIGDLKDMPHLLIAGSTGAGKTVCLNAMLCSLLFKASPWELKLILVDPKMVEMTQYADIPHLFTPIVSDAKKAANVLSWAVEEMERRYSVLAEEGARNITVFNEKKSKEEQLPYIVIVVDELADLMMVGRDQIETAIVRIAQLARAVGIHLILATQRPSADIITGLMKNNLPARIAFKVPTQIDSRVIMDHMGAEKLLGKGDMLYLGPGLLKPIRGQACYISDEDIYTLVDFIKDQNIPIQYNNRIDEIQKKGITASGDKDDLLNDAIRVIMETGQASASMIQRRLRIGYNRAARLVDLMEAEGIVGAFQGSKPRAILVDPQSYLKQMDEKSGA
jgi:S-DNA-T family DNA segregation ATPase FtsK/SpoIIIE